jgi:AcrR family transcriptional regulator
MSTPIGLRERKKQQTRVRILEAALALFAERGFDHVPVVAVAREADVSEATVFNYFPTKEDLVYDGMQAFDEQLLDAVRSRPAGTTVLEAFRDHLLQPRGALSSDDPAMVEKIATAARIIAGSAALQTREQQVVDRWTRALSELIATERSAHSGDIRPWVVANALMGVHRAMTRAVHDLARQGRSGPSIARTILTQGRRAFDALEQGLTD